jgi:hypothetical protein
MGDRTTRPPGEAAEFQKKFEGFAKAVHPGYERNKLVRGIRHECLRELLPGVFASHNAICWKGTYYHSFGITLHRELAYPWEVSPLVIGERFYGSAKLAFFRDVEPNRKYPFGELNFSDSHSYRRGWEPIVERCLGMAEGRMLPHYLARMMEYKKPVLHLLEMLLSLGEIPTDMVPVRRLPSPRESPLDYDMRLFVEGYRAAARGRDQFVSDIIHSKPELFNKIREMRTLPDLLTTLRS